MFDPSVGEYIIDAEAFETIKNDPGPIFLDSSELQLNDTGYYQVALDGALSDALGWQVDDILLSLDGYPLGSLSDFAEAYTNLAEKDQFQLSVQRGRQVVVLRYRVE